MSKNYDRYAETSSKQYEKRTIMSYFCRLPADRVLLPMLARIKGKKILDVGLGTGYYTRLLTAENQVTGVDRNPHLCKLPITVHQAGADELGRVVGHEKFDTVFSTWMTEYLSPDQLRAFFSEAKQVPADRGQLITTIVSRRGFGLLYVTAAKLIRGIDKYNYTKKDVVNMLKDIGFTDIKIINLSSWLYVPWAYLAVAS